MTNTKKRKKKKSVIDNVLLSGFHEPGFLFINVKKKKSWKPAQEHYTVYKQIFIVFKCKYVNVICDN